MKVIYFNYLYDTQNLSVGSSVHVNEFVKEFQKFHDIKVFNQNQFNYNGTEEPGFYGRIKIGLKRKLSKWLNQIMALLKNAKYIVAENKIINKERPDVILSRYDLMNFSSVLLAKLKGIPIILEVNSPHAYESKKFYKQYFQLPIIPGLIEKLNLKFSDAVVVVSNELKDYLVGLGIPESKIYVVCNGVDVSKFTANNNNNNNIKNNPEYAGKIVIGYVGSFHYWHGLDKIQTVIQELLKFHQDVHFLLVGDGVLRDDLLEFIRDEKIEKRVSLPGYIPHQDIPNYLSSMDIMIAPYPNIDFFYFSPLKLFEYMASGKAIVASRIGQIKEILTEKDNGLMFEAGNYAELIEQLKLVVSNPDLRERIGKHARKTVEANFTWQDNAQKISNICETLISN
ncbi:MAG: glycosyltransferase family 4 protein [Bacteroidetes bacterium]|nr:glycosyltransferase family 4 protein [Bacteroidota bacterium]